MPTASGHRKLLEQLEADGITTMFGNPGSSEEGLLDEISRFPGIRYILGLQEATVVQIAAGFAQATQRPTAVQLHCSVGTGNALGSLYHVFRKQRTPLVVIAGEAGMSYDALDAHMALDLVTFARPVTKYAARAIHPGSLLRLLRRCIKTAMTPPFGPTYLAVPQDVLDMPNDEPVLPTSIPDTRVAPSPEAIAHAAELLAGAENPVIIIGDGVSHAQAHGELATVAERLGAGVWGAMVSELNIPWSHPLYRGLTGHMFGSTSRRIVEDADAVLICGTYVFPDVFPLVENPFRPDAKIVHIDLDTYALAKNHAVTLALASDPKPTLALLADALAARMTPAQKQAAAARAEQLRADKAAARLRDLAADAERREAVPLYMSAFAEELAKHLPPDAIVYDEALTSSGLTRYFVPERPGSFFQTPGGTLGVAFPGAIGVKIAHPDRTVIGFGGDGGALYTFQSLWTAAHYRVAAKFVVCNNRSYRLLKDNLVVYWRDMNIQQTNFPPSFDIHDPEIDYVALAKGLGVPGLRVTKPGEMAGAISAMLSHDGPFLIDLIMEDSVHR
ncbi:MAG: thiamine pyrophosphate-binding protein [Rhodospirillales bacterium]|nr:thiamine pyrophosphate-binding protein [Rhodospirillales bacterium]